MVRVYPVGFFCQLFITPVVVNRSREAFPGKDGETYVKYFKISKTWAVQAESEADALKLVVADPDKYLDAQTITRTEYLKPKQNPGGWANGFKEQLLGSSASRTAR